MNARDGVILTLGAVAVAGLSVLASISPALAFGLIAAAVIVLATAITPTVGAGIWVAVLVLVPDWTPTPIGLKPISAVGLLVLAGVLLSRRRQRLRISLPDFALVGAAILVLLLTIFFAYPIFLLSNLVMGLLLAYWVGRTAPEAARRAYLVGMLFVSVWGVLEFATHIHLFTDWFPSPNHHLGDIQSRSGVDRSEAAFGHAIAYGAAISMAIPFARELPKHAGLAQAILLLGVVASLSRGPILTAGLTLGLCVIFATTGRRRVASVLFLGVVLAGIWLIFQLLYGGEDGDTTALSGEQRVIQLERTLPNVQLFGSFDLVVVNGQLIAAGTETIDNTFLRLAINFGWIVALLMATPLLFAIYRLLRGHHTPSSLALLGQIPVLAVTSLITQWQAALFFVAGMAVAELLRDRPSPKEPALALDRRPYVMR